MAVKKMNKGKFRAGMEEAYRFLDGLSIVRTKNINNFSQCESCKFSAKIKKMAKQDDYIDLYQHAIAFNEYDILMKDFSFFQFSFDADSYVIRMAYYPSPDVITTFKEYMDSFDNRKILWEEEQRYREEYENYIDSQNYKSTTVPLRYDYSEKEYQGLVHSAAHLHFGQMETIRVTCAHVFSPLSFAVIVVNYYYYSIWKERIKLDKEFKHTVLSVKKQCAYVDTGYLSPEEQGYFLIS